MPRDKPRGGRVKERGGCVRRDGGGGLVWSGTLGPQAGTQERKCSRECNLLKWNERHARVPCVSSRGEMIEVGGRNGGGGGVKWPRGELQLGSTIYTHFVFVYAGNKSQFLST